MRLAIPPGFGPRDRHDDWREGLAGAFRHFGGVTQTVLVNVADRAICPSVGAAKLSIRGAAKMTIPGAAKLAT